MANQAVFGMVKTRAQATGLIRDVGRAGFKSDQISVLVPETAEATGAQPADELEMLPGFAEVPIPSARTIRGAGPLVTTLAGWSTAGVTHGLVAVRLAEPLARVYEKLLAGGGILISVQARDPKDVDRVKAIFWQNAADHVGASEPLPGLSARPSRPPGVIAL